MKFVSNKRYGLPYGTHPNSGDFLPVSCSTNYGGACGPAYRPGRPGYAGLRCATATPRPKATAPWQTLSIPTANLGLIT
ncbi:hypothetical protein [Mucilaginibacter psychrotolerans]|uniref:Uncharacterized protein n=1 Tax=Mucilaginibacter psychrotolerans TaxID=1524096 RepID=A0A4Y8SB47_9SPHI|nr:hypothetical protein [Mucilaginibacter psychrotolerans]TFF36323.1 hypothetical protein E2R66_15925 [Mucilaginibacter psychrotolerans]